MNEELRVIISAEINKLKSGVKNAQKAVKDFAAKAKDNISKFNEEFQKVGEVSKTALGAMGTAVAGAATALFALSASTAEYRDAQARLVSAFESAGGSANTAKKTYNDLFRVMGDTDAATEAAQSLSRLTTNEKSLGEYTTILTGIYAKYGDGMPLETIAEAITETAATATVTGDLSRALVEAGINEDAFNASLQACNTEAEREKLIRETLNGLYSDAAANYEKNNAAILAQNEAQGRLNDAMAKVGGAIAPIQTALTDLAANVLAQLTPYVEDFSVKYLPAIQEALGDVGTKIGEVITWIADNWDLLVNLGTVILVVAAACSVFSTALGIVNAVMYASPITWIIAAIVALIAVIALCVIYWDEIKAAIVDFALKCWEWLGDLWNKITEWVSGIAEKFSKWWSDTKQGFLDWFSGIKQGWADMWSSVKEAVSNGVKTVKQWFGNMKDYIATIIGLAKDAAIKKFEEIKSGLIEKASNAKEKVVETFKNIKSGITTAIDGAKTAISTKFSQIYTNIKLKVTDALSIVTDKFGSIKTKITDTIDGAKTIVSDAVTAIKGFFNFEWSLPKPKLPHFSVSGGEAPWGFLGEGSLPKISIDWYAKGGVFDKPTIFPYGNGKIGGLGEAGAEAIVPLEKNTEWLDKIADKLAARQGATPIVLTVDGKVFAQTSIDSINQLTRQTGALGINIV